MTTVVEFSMDSYMTIPVKLSDNGTIEFSIKCDGAFNNNTFFDSPVSSDVWKCYYNYNNDLVAKVGNGTEIIVSEAPLNGYWVHIAFTWERAGNMNLYIDGVLKGTAPTSWVESASYFYIGGGNTGNTKGSFEIKNIRVWNVARTAQEIIDTKGFMYKKGFNGTLVANYTMEEGSGNKIRSEGTASLNEATITTTNPSGVDWNIISVFEIDYDIKNKTLVKFNNMYHKYDFINKAFQPIGSTLSETTFIDNGMSVSEVSSIPNDKWSALTGEVELVYYTDDMSETEKEFEIETVNSFSLFDKLGSNPTFEWYTDDPDAKPIITIETEPFDFYHEMGDWFDILYYTDDESITKTDLELTANYSPLDEISGDFDVVTWTNGIAFEKSESLTPEFKEESDGGDLYSVAVDLTKGNGIKSIK